MRANSLRLAERRGRQQMRGDSAGSAGGAMHHFCEQPERCVTNQTMRDWMREKLMRRRSKRGPNESESTGKIGQELPTNQLAPLRPDYPEPAEPKAANLQPQPDVPPSCMDCSRTMHGLQPASRWRGADSGAEDRASRRSRSRWARRRRRRWRCRRSRRAGTWC